MDHRRCVSRSSLRAPRPPRAIIVLGLFLLVWLEKERCCGASAAAAWLGHLSAPALVATTMSPGTAGRRPAWAAPPFQGLQRSVPRTPTTATTPHRGPATAAFSAASSRFLSRFNIPPLGMRGEGSRSSDPREDASFEAGDNKEEKDDDDRPFDPGQQGTAGPPPVYDRTALARTVFAHPYFYDYKPGAAELYRDEREATFGKDTTVEQVYLQYTVPPGSVSELVRKIHATDRRLVAYFAPAAAAATSIEDLLAQREMVGLSSGDELRKVSRRYVKGLPAMDRVRRSLLSQHPDDDSSRKRRLCYIFGPSGSGKTFFATNEMRNFGNNEAGGIPAVTLYFTPEAVAQNRDDGYWVDNDDDETVPIDFRRDDAPDRLVKRVISLLDNVIRGWGKSWNRNKLKMHVSLVFDEAGAFALNGFFDKPAQVDRVVKLAQEKIATSIMVVVAGTGLGELAYDPRREVYVFRMQSWGKDDLECILAVRDGFKHKLRRGESVRTAVNAAFDQPVLAALATNARAAGFLANSVEQMARLATCSWVEHLRMVAPEVVSRVIVQYEQENAVSRLGPSQRRRVAAWVFAVLATLEKGSTVLPDFDGLDRQERAVAASLLQYNVEVSGDKRTLIGSNQFSASLTPATAIILYSMCGIPANVLIGWESLEATAALYAVRRLIEEQGKKHICNIQTIQQSYVSNRPRMSLREFESELEKQSQKDAYDGERRKNEASFEHALETICLIRLTSRVQRPPSRTSLVSIPMVTSTTVLVNGNGEDSSFAEVIAPYMFIRTKPTEQSTIHVNLTRELDKCCLLKECRDDRLLRGLIMVWDGCFSNSDEGNHISDETDLMGANEALLQESVAYPENLIEVRPPVDPVPGYVTVDSECSIMAGSEQSQLQLPSLPSHRSVEFILFTNAESIQLTFLNDSQQEGRVLVDRTVWGDDLQLSLEKIGETNLWFTFLNDRVQEGVTVRFVFTNPKDASPSVAR